MMKEREEEEEDARDTTQLNKTFTIDVNCNKIERNSEKKKVETEEEKHVMR